MKEPIYLKGHFIVFKTHDDLVVVNTQGEYKNHAHLNKKSDKKGKINLTTAKTLINIVMKKSVPRSEYLLISATRLTTDEQYRDNLNRILEKRRTKKYININKGGLR